jgi:hypothetical protein
MIKENEGGGEFKYDVFDILQELLKMPQCTPTQHNNNKTSKNKNSKGLDNGC